MSRVHSSDARLLVLLSSVRKPVSTSHMHTHTHTYLAHIHRYITHLYRHLNRHKYRHLYWNLYRNLYRHLNSHTLVHIQSHIQSHIQALIHSHTHTYRHTHAHTYRCLLPPFHTCRQLALLFHLGKFRNMLHAFFVGCTALSIPSPLSFFPSAPPRSSSITT